MMRRTVWAVVVMAMLAAFLLPPPAAQAANKTWDKTFGEPQEDQALVYLIRQKRFQASARTMFLYSDRQFLGTLENNSYTFVHLEPGKHLLWLNWAKYNLEIELQAGKTYYLDMWMRIESLGEEWGKSLLGQVKFYCTPEEKEMVTAQEHVEKRHGKATRVAERKPEGYAGSRSQREQHVAKWPRVDLSTYSVLCIEPFELIDPKAQKRKKAMQVKTAPARLAERIETTLEDGLFAEVLHGPAEGPMENAVMLRLEISQYKPGSRGGRAMLAGVGSAHLDFTGHLIDGVTGEELSVFSGKRTWAWGGVAGESFGIEEIEKNVAYEIASYLKQSKG